MGFVGKAGSAFALVVVAVSVLGTRWNARGGVFDPLPEVSASHDGKRAVAIVTGGNTGLGYEMVKGLYRHNYAVIMACRNPEKCAAAQRKLQEEEKTAAGEIATAIVDMASFASVRDFAASLSDVNVQTLINNAGIWANQALTADKISHTAQINHYSGFLLTNLLKFGDGARVINLSSAMHRDGVDFRNDPLLLDPALLASPRGGALYGSSKLMNILHSKALSKRSKKITSFSVHPGIIRTELHREENDATMQTFMGKWVMPLVWSLIGISPEQGAASTLFVAMTDQKLIPGSYFHGALAREPVNKLANDVELEDLLWTKSVEITKSDLKQ